MSTINTFEVSCEITRAENTTQYTAGYYVNSLANTTLPELDFSNICGPCDDIQITAASITSNNGSASTKLSAAVHLFNINNVQASCADNTAVTVPYATAIANRATTLEDVSNANSFGTTGYSVSQFDVSRIARVSASGKLYPAIVATNAYTPASGEKLTLKLVGFVL